MFYIDSFIVALFFLHKVDNNKGAAKKYKILLGNSNNMCDGSLRFVFDNSTSGGGMMMMLIYY